MDIPSLYHELIERLVAASGQGDKMLHMHAGMAIYLGAQIVLGTRRGSLDAWMAVVAAEATNEVLDFLFRGGWAWGDTGTDVLATLFWPTALLLHSRYRRRRWARAEAARSLLVHTTVRAAR